MPKVKICGVKTLADAMMCASAGADYVGNIVNIPSSPRSISVEKSKKIFSLLPESTLGIAVTASKSPEEVVEIARAIDPCCVQLHGYEDPVFVEKVKEGVSCKVIKAVHVKGVESIERALEYAEFCDAILLDTYSKRLGGSGKIHDWGIAKKIVEQADCHVFLAGGLNPENIVEARNIVSPFCLDVSSGVEKSPGVKDPEKVKRFIARAKDRA
jgi:phosphoribosylanthranilate isomerase